MAGGYLESIEKRLAGHPNRARWIEAVLQEKEVGRQLAARLRRRGLPPGARVLEVGCAEGGISIGVQQAGLRAVGLEIAAGRLEAARLRAEEDGVRPGLVRGSAYALPLLASSVDAVVMENVIEHLQDWPEAVVEVARVLRPGGLLAVTLPHRLGVRTVLSDPHWEVFGLVLLPRRAAAALVVRVLKRAEVYDVYDMPSLSRLRGVFAAAGLELRLHSGVDRLIDKARGQPGLKGVVRRAVAGWLNRGAAGRAAYLAYRRFVSSVWILEGEKVAQSRS